MVKMVALVDHMERGVGFVDVGRILIGWRIGEMEACYCLEVVAVASCSVRVVVPFALALVL